ncbi:MAG: polysaccharide biosynthesis/export family protein, partial [Rikenellaceae bacterium]
MKRLMLIVFVVLMWCSCASHKEVAYLQGISDVEYSQDITIPYEVKIKPDDLIAIMVNSRDPELAQLFNLPLISYQVNSKLTGQNRVLGYLVDKSGCINFPQLGRIEIVGMSRTELTNYIESELRGRGLVIDPIVTVQYLNYRVSVIGEVN